MNDILQKIYDYSLEEIMGERFGRYSKYIIQDRAIPDVRDGLKPVQRRILYAMYKNKNTYDKGYLKSATTVGEVIGKYHPHGDSSVYEAMVRLSQDWKQNHILIDMHGNNGSIDGDSAAAYRYTEARLSKISNELLKDIEKNTVITAPNYDDKHLEPTVLPSAYPNLLVNGTSGISAGYATNIPPHNLGEIIDATIKRIDSPNCRLETIMDIIKGPDFPTGGTACGLEGIKTAFETGKGRVIVKAKTAFEKNKGKEQLIITEIPYEVNKANLVKKIDEIRIDKKVDGILEVRDESDRKGLRVAIDLKKDANKELVLNYLLKNTDLQISYNYNMVGIVNRRPKLLGILSILDAYIEHRKEVITRRSEFDLAHAKKRIHIVEGLIKAISILDEVITTIRKSKNKADSIDNLIKEFDFTFEQADAIVTLQLYRLTNTDITSLETEFNNLNIIIKALTSILADEDKLKQVMKDELRKIRNEYQVPRKTVIEEEIPEIKLDTTKLIQKEDCYVVVTKDGYIKRVSPRSYGSSNNEETTLKELDYVIGFYKLTTLDTILLFTDLGNYLFVPVHEIPEAKWKELGKHVSNVITITEEESIIDCMPVTEFDDRYITVFTKNGMVKRSILSDYKVQRYSKPISNIGLKKGDRVISVSYNQEDNILIVTSRGYALRYDINQVPIIGMKAVGVKAINLKDDIVVTGIVFKDDSDYLTVITNKGNGKRIKLMEIEPSNRARKGLLILKELKTNPAKVLKVFVENSKNVLGLKTLDNMINIKITEISIMDRYSQGSNLIKGETIDAFIKKELEEEMNIKEEESDTNIKKKEKEISLQEVDDRIMTIDDFLKDFNLDE